MPVLAIYADRKGEQFRPALAALFRRICAKLIAFELNESADVKKFTGDPAFGRFARPNDTMRLQRDPRWSFSRPTDISGGNGILFGRFPHLTKVAAAGNSFGPFLPSWVGKSEESRSHLNWATRPMVGNFWEIRLLGVLSVLTI